MDNSEKLARGGVRITPSLANGKKVPLILRFALKHQAGIQAAYEEIVEYDSSLTCDNPTFEGLLDRYKNAETIVALDYAAIILTLTQLPIDDCLDLRISNSDKIRIQAALFAYLPEKRDYTQEELDLINKDQTAKEVQQSFLAVCHNSRSGMT